MAAIGAAFATGYLIAAVIIFPAPLLPGRQTMPLVIALSSTDAQTQLRRLNLRPAVAAQQPHDLIPAGSTIWQDPPAGTVVLERTEVSLIISTGPAAAIVPDVRNLDAQLARRIIAAAGLRVGGVDSIQAPTPTGVVVQSRPDAGMALEPGARVQLIVSRGEPTIVVPDVIGLALGDARTAIEGAGLTLGSDWARTDVSATPGTVVEQRPAAGTLAAPGTPVDLIFARSPTSQ